MACKSPEALARQKKKQAEIKRQIRSQMKEEGRKSVTCWISTSNHDRLSEIANEEFPGVVKEDAYGRLIDRLIDNIRN